MKRRERLREESGAALVIALLFITVVGLVVGVLLTFSDANLRATIVLRKQAAQTYTADGAAQVAINSVRESTFTNGSDSSCAAAGFPLALAPFSTDTAAPTYASTLITCERKPGTAPVVQQPAPVQPPAVVNALNTTKFALLTLGTAPATENGISVSGISSTDVLDVDGKIASNSTVRTATGYLKSDTSVTANGLCSGTIVAPVKTCYTGSSQAWPAYDAPTAAAVAAAPAQSTPSCPYTGGLVTFSPGVYTNATTLTACDRSNITMLFTPGTYYFNFPSTAPKWTMTAGALIGGTPTDPNYRTSVPSMPGSCVSPLAPTTDQFTPPAANAGVQFVFAGPSQWEVRGSAEVELCGSYSATSPPIAIFGLQLAAGTLPAQNGCVIAPGGCPLVSLDGDLFDTSALYVQGTVYAAKALIAMAESRYYRQIDMAVNGGIIARSFSAVLSSASLNAFPGVIQVPALTPLPPVVPAVPIPQPNLPEVVLLLKVYVCPGLAACTTADVGATPPRGRLRLETKIGVSNPPTGAVALGARGVNVYSWAMQR